MLFTFIGLVIFSVVFVFSISNTKYHILCSGLFLFLFLFSFLLPSFSLSLSVDADSMKVGLMSSE